jgi:hypothetical protein
MSSAMPGGSRSAAFQKESSRKRVMWEGYRGQQAQVKVESRKVGPLATGSRTNSPLNTHLR